MLEGWLWRQQEQKARRERAESVAAYFVCGLMNLEGKSLKHKLSMKDLLEPLQGKPQQDKQSGKEYLLKTFGLGGEQNGNNR